MLSLSLLAFALSAADPTAWHTDFLKASLLAKEQKKDLVIHFRADSALDNAFDSPEVRERLARFICVRLPMAYVYKGEKMIERDPLAAMMKKPGLCVVSRHDDSLPTHDSVISAHPIVGSDYRWAPTLGAREIGIALDLPIKATLSQRSMIFAITVHPDGPRSVYGSAHSGFLSHAGSHSDRQASMRNQHHADLGAVMRNIGGVSGASEVVAESWGNVVGGEHVLEACYSCVDAWRHSAGHWRSIMSEHRYFGYDIARGANGTWYGTGIFGD